MATPITGLKLTIALTATHINYSVQLISNYQPAPYPGIVLGIRVDGKETGLFITTDSTGKATGSLPLSNYAVGWHSTFAYVQINPTIKSQVLPFQILSTQPPPSDTTPPTVSILPPNPPVNTTGTLIKGTASDNVNLQRVEVQIDSSTWHVASGTTTWQWMSPPLSEGSHVARARAIDTSGNISMIAAVNFTVNAPPPVMAIPWVLVGVGIMLLMALSK